MAIKVPTHQDLPTDTLNHGLEMVQKRVYWDYSAVRLLVGWYINRHNSERGTIYGKCTRTKISGRKLGQVDDMDLRRDKDGCSRTFGRAKREDTIRRVGWNGIDCCCVRLLNQGNGNTVVDEVRQKLIMGLLFTSKVLL